MVLQWLGIPDVHRLGKGCRCFQAGCIGTGESGTSLVVLFRWLICSSFTVQALAYSIIRSIFKVSILSHGVAIYFPLPMLALSVHSTDPAFHFAS